MRSAIYGRVSGVDDQRDGSLETQAEIATAHAISLGYETGPADVFLDRFTGAELYDRPALSQLREKVRQGVYQAITVRFLDRLSREPAHLAILFDEAERHGCKIISATEEIDNSPIGELIRNIRGFAAKMERIRIKERTLEETKKIVASGKPPCSGVARFGYAYEKETRTRVINEEEAEVVRRVYRMAIEGFSVRRICLVLNAEGVPSPGAARGRTYKDGRKCTWSKSTVLLILKDPSYHGAPMSWHKTRNTGKRLKNGRAEVEKLPPDSWTPLADPTPAIVDRETWERANGTMDGRKTAEKTARSRNQWIFRLLRGFVYCGTCGRTMTVQTVAKWTKSKGRYEFYRCMSNHRVGELPDLPRGCGNGRTHVSHADAETWRQVSEMLSSRDNIRQRLEASCRPDPSLDDDLAAHDAEIAKAEATIKRLVDRLGDEEDDVIAATLKEKVGLQRKVIASHRKAIDGLKGRIAQRASINEAVVLIESIVARQELDLQARAEQALGLETGELKTDVRRWLAEGLRGLKGPALTEHQKRDILIALGVKVYLKRTEVVVECHLPISPPSPHLKENQGDTKGTAALVDRPSSAAGRVRPAAPAAWATR